MARRVTATEARIHFGELLREVAADGESFVVERAGRPAAAIVPLKDYERLRANETEPWQESLARATRLVARIRERRGDRPFPPPEEMIAESRRERDDDLTGLR